MEALLPRYERREQLEHRRQEAQTSQQEREQMCARTAKEEEAARAALAETEALCASLEGAETDRAAAAEQEQALERKRRELRDLLDTATRTSKTGGRIRQRSGSPRLPAGGLPGEKGGI